MENQNLHRLILDGREIILIGCAHVSRASADLVEKVIAEEKPDVVLIELCKARFDAMRQKEKWQETDIIKVIRDKRASLLLFQLFMMSFQKKIAEKFNISPGEEMLRAISGAEKIGAEIVLADREIRITLLRAWRMMRFFRKIKLLTAIPVSILFTEEVTEEDIEKLKQKDVLETALQTMGLKMPELKAILIDERDQYLAYNIAHTTGRKIVAVVGAGHIPGITKNMGREIDMEMLKRIPPPHFWAKVAGWAVPALVMALFVAGFFYAGSHVGMNMIKWWIVITATCSGIGALVLLAHPATVVASAIAAPITTLHPLLAAGWVAGLTEATLRKPQVKDFLNLKDDITTLRGFFRNKVTRILLLIAIVNLTASIGAMIAIPVIMRLF
ncbi:MAG: TraB/GumN family protein [Syntrophales bacterium]|nr:TraB/GumN family protein [Syntrophales bacterium]